MSNGFTELTYNLEVTNLLLAPKVPIQTPNSTNPPYPYAGAIDYNPYNSKLYYGDNFVWNELTTGGATTLASAGGTSLVFDGVGPGLIIKGLAAGTGITLTDQGTTVAITANGTNITLTNIGSVTGSLVPGGAEIGPALTIKGILAADNTVTIASTATDVTIAANLSLVNIANLGVPPGVPWVLDGTGPDMTIRSITAGVGITLTPSLTDVTVTANGTNISLTDAGVIIPHQSLVNDTTGPTLAVKGISAFSPALSVTSSGITDIVLDLPFTTMTLDDIIVGRSTTGQLTDRLRYDAQLLGMSFNAGSQLITTAYAPILWPTTNVPASAGVISYDPLTGIATILKDGIYDVNSSCTIVPILGSGIPVPGAAVPASIIPDAGEQVSVVITVNGNAFNESRIGSQSSQAASGFRFQFAVGTTVQWFVAATAGQVTAIALQRGTSGQIVCYF